MIVTSAGKHHLKCLKRKMNLFSSLLLILECENEEKLHVIVYSFLFSH